MTRPTENEQKNERQNANASAKSKELHPPLKADPMQHICFCPNARKK